MRLLYRHVKNMKRITGIALIALVAGCQPTVPEPVINKPAQPVETKPVAETKPAPQAEPAKPKAGDNAKRIYQLADLKKGTIKIDGHNLTVWVMDDDGKRQEGMMWLTDKEVKDDEAMLFVFPSVEPHANAGFWMQNTILPLDIMYFTPKNKLTTIAEGKPFDEKSLPAKEDYQYVVEMKQGSAKRLGFKVGSTISIPEDLKKAL